MHELIRWFRSLTKRESEQLKEALSKDTAAQRLKLVLIQDRLELAPLPYPDDVQAGEPTQVRVANAPTHERGSVDWKLGNYEILEFADSVGCLGPCGHA